MRTRPVYGLVALCLTAMSASAQPAQHLMAREDALDPSPVDAAKDPDVGKFINDWRSAKPRTEYGKLVLHDILTRLDSPDPTKPNKRGAVLTQIDSVSYATLAPGSSIAGRERAGMREVFYATGGTGKVSASGKSYAVSEGSGFTLTPDFDFRLTSTGKTPLSLYVRYEPVPFPAALTGNLVFVDRFDGDRKIGAHWVHTCNGGPNGLNLCTVPPHTMPQPHSHPQEEAWIMVKGESILSLGKTLVKMHPGQAYKIPPTGLTAHSNLNLTDEPIELIYLGPAVREGGRPPATGPGSLPPATDFARLDNAPIDPAAEPDVDMFMGNWRDAFPRMEHGNLYLRDMLTALQGPDAQHPTRKGAVLVNAEAVSYGLLEPRSSAHPLPGELKDAQETFVVDGGTGVIASGGQSHPLSKGVSFILTPGLDYRLTATGDKYMSFYVVTEKLPAGAAPKGGLTVIDDTGRPQTVQAWVDKDRPLITKADGLVDYAAITEVEQPSMTMTRPYSSAKDGEEIWIATDDDVDMLIGKELRKVTMGTAYKIPPTGITARANINLSGRTAGFLYLVK